MSQFYLDQQQPSPPGYAVGINDSHQPLHGMINQLSTALSSSANLRRNTLINEVSTALYVRANPVAIHAVIRHLLGIVLNHSENGLIRLSAKIYGDVLLLHIKNRNTQCGPEFNKGLQVVQQMAEHVHGNVSITSFRNDVTTVALSFINQPCAA